MQRLHRDGIKISIFQTGKSGKNAQNNIGLGKGKNLDTFNENIVSFENVKIEGK